ncbi:rRNA maturation RNase YbeY [Stieleria sp. TO1_6]|uniref:rRNA maturation RNase YbeY n=1 Tax=Stieleria tagensis TaxID=2956795 RepID=UPI00209ADD8C|nr:rRNA maturation RNase YbeY [Stieleria tagensis]MCO8120917.1 rRNA maturation RNase YbeY [Stieleria tagensis]
MIDPGAPQQMRPASDPDSSPLTVEILWDSPVQDWRQRLDLTDQRIVQAVVLAAAERGFDSGEIGVRVTDDRSIHEINRRHLSHDYPTDVISFMYRADGGQLEGELVVSIDTAAENADQADWSVAEELLLYVIHGVLHIGGMDDHAPDDREAMRRSERAVLQRMGVRTTADDASASSEGSSVG